MLIKTFALCTRSHYSKVQHNHPASVCRIVHALDEVVVVSVRAGVDVFTSARTISATFAAAERLILRLRFAIYRNNSREGYTAIIAGKAGSVHVVFRQTFIPVDWLCFLSTLIKPAFATGAQVLLAKTNIAHVLIASMITCFFLLDICLLSSATSSIRQIKEVRSTG